MILEKYEQLEVIGKGGQGVVYKVRKKIDRTIYALKIVDMPKIQETKKKRIESQIKSLTSLEHPGVVKIYSIEQNNNILNIEMDYIEGETLQESINRGFKDYQEGIDLMLKVLQPMIYVHSQNIAHLDIKPENIIFDGNKKPIIVDFGSSFFLDNSKEIYTGKDNRGGTPGYMAPEIVKSKHNKFNPKLADIYSLGATLYTILTQKTIYETSQYNYIYSLIKKERIIPPHEINKKIDQKISQLCMKALAYEPEKRISSCEQFYNELESILNGVSTSQYEPRVSSIFKKVLIGSISVPIIFGSYLFIANFMGKKSPQYYYDLALKYEKGSVSEAPNYKKSLEYYIKAANAGNTDTFIAIGNLYRDGGYGLMKNYPKAIHWYEKSAKVGSSLAMESIGHLYRDGGYGLRKDYLQSLEWYEKAIKEKNDKKPFVETEINRLYQIIANRCSKKEALEWYQKIEEKGYDEVSFYIKILNKNHENSSLKKSENLLDYYIKLFQSGDRSAISKIREIYNKRKDKVFENYSEAFEVYNKCLPFLKIADQSKANISIGLLYFEGDDTFRTDYVKAEKYYKQGLLQGNKYALILLGELYSQSGNGFKRDLEKAKEYYKQANEYKELQKESYLKLGKLKQQRNDSMALDYYLKALKMGNKNALYLIGFLHEYGRCGLRVNYIEALEWYRKAAEGGDSNGMLSLGEMYASGRGVEQDNGEALKWYEKSALKNNILGIILAGNMYKYERDGIKKNYKKALEYYKKVVNKKDPNIRNVIYQIGEIYKEGGHGVEADWTQALKWYKKAEKMGNYYTILPIVCIYKEGGYGVEKNYNKAIEEYRLYLRRGVKIREEVEKNLNSLIGDIYFKGDRTLTKNWKDAVEYYDKNEYPNLSLGAILNLIEMYYKGGHKLEKNRGKALYFYEIFDLFDKSNLTQDEKSRIQEMEKIFNELDNLK